MSHLTNDEILDHSLEEDPEIEKHLRACRECGRRYEAVLDEQDLLRAAFAEVDPPARRHSMPWAVAAAFVLSVAAGYVGYRMLQREPEPAPVPRDVRPVSHHPRQAMLAGTASEGVATDWLSEELTLTEPQERAVDRLFERLERDGDEEAFAEGMRGVLSEEQFHSFERLSAEFMADFVVEELSAALDLRYSEAGALRVLLCDRRPSFDWPSNPLVDDPKLAAEVRASLAPEYHAKFDAWLSARRDERRR